MTPINSFVFVTPGALADVAEVAEKVASVTAPNIIEGKVATPVAATVTGHGAIAIAFQFTSSSLNYGSGDRDEDIRLWQAEMKASLKAKDVVFWEVPEDNDAFTGDEDTPGERGTDMSLPVDERIKNYLAAYPEYASDYATIPNFVFGYFDRFIARFFPGNTINYENGLQAEIRRIVGA